MLRDCLKVLKYTVVTLIITSSVSVVLNGLTLLREILLDVSR